MKKRLATAMLAALTFAAPLAATSEAAAQHRGRGHDDRDGWDGDGDGRDRDWRRDDRRGDRYDRRDRRDRYDRREARRHRWDDRRYNGYNYRGQWAQTLGNLGDLYAQQKEYTEAARHYSNATQEFAQSNEKEKQAQVLRALSLMELRRGQYLAAIMRMDESLQVRPRLSIPQHLFKWLLRFTTKLLRGE